MAERRIAEIDDIFVEFSWLRRIMRRDEQLVRDAQALLVRAKLRAYSEKFWTEFWANGGRHECLSAEQPEGTKGT